MKSAYIQVLSNFLPFIAALILIVDPMFYKYQFDCHFMLFHLAISEFFVQILHYISQNGMEASICHCTVYINCSHIFLQCDYRRLTSAITIHTIDWYFTFACASIYRIKQYVMWFPLHFIQRNNNSVRYLQRSMRSCTSYTLCPLDIPQ